jgi:hypothetical protein
MEWCEGTQGVDNVFGFAGNDVLHALTRETAAAIAALRALSGEDKLRGFKAFRYGAGSWNKERRFVARIEATSKGLDVHYVVTSLKAGAQASLRGPLSPARKRRELHQAAQEPALL